MSNYDINSNQNLVRLMIENDKKTYEQKIKDNPDSLIPLFINELRELGYTFEAPCQISGFLPKHKEIILPLAIEFYQHSNNKIDKNFFMGLFHFRGFEEVVPILLEDFYSDNPSVDKWAIGDRLYQIRSKKYIDDYLRIVTDSNYGSSRQMIVLLLGKLKAKKALPVLIDVIDDSDITGHVINALSQYRREELRTYFERFLNHDNRYYRHEAQKAIKKLDALKIVN